MNRIVHSCFVGFLAFSLFACQGDGHRRGDKYQSYWDMPRAQATRIRDFFASNLNVEWAQTRIADHRISQAEQAFIHQYPNEAMRLLTTLNIAQLNQYALIRVHLLSAEIAYSQKQTGRAAFEISKIPTQMLTPEQTARYRLLLTKLPQPPAPLPIQAKSAGKNQPIQKTALLNSARGTPIQNQALARPAVKRLLLVLPLQGKTANQSRAMRDGFLTGYWQAKSHLSRDFVIQVADRQNISTNEIQRIAKQPGTLVLAPQISPKLTPSLAFDQGKQSFMSVIQASS